MAQLHNLLLHLRKLVLELPIDTYLPDDQYGDQYQAGCKRQRNPHRMVPRWLDLRLKYRGRRLSRYRIECAPQGVVHPREGSQVATRLGVAIDQAPRFKGGVGVELAVMVGGDQFSLRIVHL
jgi:hypothetical protein